jgi:hypothetical protein
MSTFGHPGGLVAVSRAERICSSAAVGVHRCRQQQGGVGQLLVAPASERFDQMMAATGYMCL